MQKLITNFALAITVLFAVSASAGQSNASESQSATVLSPSEYFSSYEQGFLVEFFWLGCSHCQNAEPHIETAMEENPDVTLVRIPATFNERWNLDASVYYAAVDKMGVDFRALIDFYKQKRLDDDELPTMDEVAAFIEKQDKNGEEFKTLVESKEVASQVRQADKLTRDMGIQGTPTFVINGEQQVDTQGVKTYKGLVEKAFEGAQ